MVSTDEILVRERVMCSGDGVGGGEGEEEDDNFRKIKVFFFFNIIESKK